MNLQEASEFTKQVRWQYAKTYPTAPHEYTCLAWKPEIKQQMVDFARIIQEAGEVEIFAKREYKVLKIDGMKYWTMDFPLENTDLINRTYVDEDLRSRMSAFVKSPDFCFKYGMSMQDVMGQMEGKIAK